MIIKILGTGCPKCHKLERLARAAVTEFGVKADFEHVTEVTEIMKYAVLSTPALVIDGKVVVAGRMPGHDELKGWLAGR